jgi:uncharacterized protein YdhG (YjbR/CyaY superfamily)
MVGAHRGLQGRVPGRNTVTGRINFRDKDPVPITALKKVIRHAVEDRKQPKCVISKVPWENVVKTR